MSETPMDTASLSRPRAEGPKRQNGSAIRHLREFGGWDSQEALAKDAGITQSRLSRIETEAINARTATLVKIARALRVPVGAIMREPTSEEDAA